MVDEIAPDAVDVYVVKDGVGESWLATFRAPLLASYFVATLTAATHDAETRLEVREL